MRSLQRGVEPEFELAWLLKIAFNVCRGVRRSTGRESAVTQEVGDIDELAAPPAAGYEGRERLAALRDALSQLPESQRRGILLREWQGLSYSEIADELGVSLGAVETLLFRARRNLASRLQHIRNGVGAFNVASLIPFLRSLWKGNFVLKGIMHPDDAIRAEVAPALADNKAGVQLRSAAKASGSAPAGTKASAAKSPNKGAAVRQPLALRTRTNGTSVPAQVGSAPAEVQAVDSGSGSDPAPTGASASGGGASSASQEAPTATGPGLPAATTPSRVEKPQLPTPQLPVPQLSTPEIPSVPVPAPANDALGFLTDALAGAQGTLP